MDNSLWTENPVGALAARMAYFPNAEPGLSFQNQNPSIEQSALRTHSYHAFATLRSRLAANVANAIYEGR
jgi:hypothetical protein